ncbi:MAG: hypothetical protein K0S76_2348 [Herbinix sp.]|nr:hypothetical protein [Herbinix sp.]
MRKFAFVMMIAFTVLLQGCSGKTDDRHTLSDQSVVNGEEKDDSDSGNSNQPIPTTEPTQEPTHDPTPEPTEAPALVLPIVINDSGKVLIQTVSQNVTYPYNTYIISSVNGENVVVDPSMMPKKEILDINPAAIISTHNHPDHSNPAYTKSYDCPNILYVKGEIKTEDFNIYSIPSSHDSDTITEAPTNVLVVFEVDGLCIVHMGDIGQTTLTKEQLTELGEIDIAFMQFENSYSSMDLENMKGFNLIEQLNPKIIIPTHYTNNSLAELEAKYGAVTEFVNSMEISKEDLPEDTLHVYRISNTHIYR